MAETRSLQGSFVLPGPDLANAPRRGWSEQELCTLRACRAGPKARAYFPLKSVGSGPPQLLAAGPGVCMLSSKCTGVCGISRGVYPAQPCPVTSLTNRTAWWERAPQHQSGSLFDRKLMAPPLWLIVFDCSALIINVPTCRGCAGLLGKECALPPRAFLWRTILVSSSIMVLLAPPCSLSPQQQQSTSA